MATRLRSGHPDYLNVAYYVLWSRDPVLVTTVFNEIKNVHKRSQRFLWNICSEKQILPRFSIIEESLKFLDDRPIHVVQFSKLIEKIPCGFLVNFLHFTPPAGLDYFS